MPTIVSPPDLERRPRRVEQDDGSGSRRPPNDRDLRRTGGGGDNDNWNDRFGNAHRPGQRLGNYRLGLFFALGAVFLFFIGIVSVLSVTRSAGHMDVYNHWVGDNWPPIAIPPILWLNTAVLLLSTVTVEIARRHMFQSIDAMEEWFGLGKPVSRRALPWLLATLVLGSLFLAGQFLAWHQFSQLGVHFLSTGGGGHAFYALTCAHALHIIVGVAGLLLSLIGLYAFKNVEDRQITVDCTAWYWHSMSVLWVCIFALLIAHR